jgi:hypothetical protein
MLDALAMKGQLAEIASNKQKGNIRCGNIENRGII